MSANDQHRKDANNEAEPRNIDSNEVDFKHPGKIDKAAENNTVNRNIAKHDDTYTAFDDHIEGDISQVDEGTIDLQEKNNRKHEVGERDIMSTESRNPDEINSTDNRDHKDSTTDWDAEQNQTGRHK
ncbi:hypothetical protein [Flavobacterium sp. 3HN19-14]|uniref:hypothetical protein n=1 Tax=Flavobacterium sp. 3HN19-14 TaxID=3448133 RepID=UPI003EDF2190